MSRIKFSTLWLAKNLSVLAFIFVASSCGFKPLYAKKDGEKANSCTNFTVSKIKTYQVSGQRMQYQLQDALNQACINQDKTYRVEVDITKAKNAIAIQKDREITRYNLSLQSNYRVYENDSAKEAYSGMSNMVGGFDAVISDYGTYALEEDTQAKLMEEMANDIALKISSVLLRKHPKK